MHLLMFWRHHPFHCVSMTILSTLLSTCSKPNIRQHLIIHLEEEDIAPFLRADHIFLHA